MMDFNPADATESTASLKLLPEGTYELKVQEAEERVSSKGNPMIALELIVSGHPGILIREYLVATPAAMFKIKNFCEAAGLMSEYNAGRITENTVRGVRVGARITIEDGTDGYSDKNRVEEFVQPSSGPAAAPVAAHAPVPEERIPF